MAWGHDGALPAWSNPGARDHHLESGLDRNEVGRMAKQSSWENGEAVEKVLTNDGSGGWGTTAYVRSVEGNFID